VLFHVDGRTDGGTDMTKLIFAFCNFAKALKTRARVCNRRTATKSFESIAIFKDTTMYKRTK
jgi:hypothetical protein